MNWEDEHDAWVSKYQPVKNHITGEDDDKFETYGAELDYVLEVAKKEPRCVWTLVDGDDGNLYIVDGYHLVNRINYFITKKPLEGDGFMEVPYYIFEEQEDEL